MADDKRARDEQADREVDRQRQRMQEEARASAREEEPMRGDLGGQLDELDAALDALDYPTTTDELVEACGDSVVETHRGEATVEELLAPTANQTFDSADDVRGRLLGLLHR